jgi:myo-inositol-1(or 4)-monophosphatase
MSGRDPSNRFLRTAVRACRAAGRIQAKAYGRVQPVEHKGEIDLVTATDRRSEEAILGILRRAFPDHGVLAEESGASLPEAEYTWVVDPLDGTTNFAHGFPFFCSSVALAHRGVVIAGAVYHPLLGELFTATRGGGAHLNGRRIRVSAQPRLDQAFLATGFPYDIRRSRRNNLDHFGRFATRSLAVRRAGAAALDLAFVAAGRFDGFWELKLRAWDIAAASLIVEEAGGRITGLQGRPWSLPVRDIVASNGLIHEEMLRQLRR